MSARIDWLRYYKSCLLEPGRASYNGSHTRSSLPDSFSTEDCWIVLIAVLNDIFVVIYGIVLNEKPNAPMVPTDKCHD